MLVRFSKNAFAAEVDRLTCVRPDGSSTAGDMTRQGILPHEAFHLVVESTLGWRDAFFGMIGSGLSVAEVVARIHGAQTEWWKITQALQSESLVECLQAEQWGGAADPAAFAGNLIATCRRRAVPPPDIMADELERVRHALREFGACWRPLLPGQTLERRF